MLIVFSWNDINYLDYMSGVGFVYLHKNPPSRGKKKHRHNSRITGLVSDFKL